MFSCDFHSSTGRDGHAQAVNGFEDGLEQLPWNRYFDDATGDYQSGRHRLRGERGHSPHLSFDHLNVGLAFFPTGIFIAFRTRNLRCVDRIKFVSRIGFPSMGNVHDGFPVGTK